MIYLPVWQHLEMNGKPEEINKNGYHYQTKHSCQEVFTNFKLKEKNKPKQCSTTLRQLFKKIHRSLIGKNEGTTHHRYTSIKRQILQTKG